MMTSLHHRNEHYSLRPFIHDPSSFHPTSIRQAILAFLCSATIKPQRLICIRSQEFTACLTACVLSLMLPLWGCVCTGGEGSNGYSWGVIFHINRGWQDTAFLLFVKLGAAHIYTRTAHSRGCDFVIKCQLEDSFHTKLDMNVSTFNAICPKRHAAQAAAGIGNATPTARPLRWPIQPVIHKCWCSRAQSGATESPELDITANCHPGTLITGLGEERWLRPLQVLVRLYDSVQENWSIPSSHLHW